MLQRPAPEQARGCLVPCPTPKLLAPGLRREAPPEPCIPGLCHRAAEGQKQQVHQGHTFPSLSHGASEGHKQQVHQVPGIRHAAAAPGCSSAPMEALSW